MRKPVDLELLLAPNWWLLTPLAVLVFLNQWLVSDNTTSVWLNTAIAGVCVCWAWWRLTKYFQILKRPWRGLAAAGFTGLVMTLAMVYAIGGLVVEGVRQAKEQDEREAKRLSPADLPQVSVTANIEEFTPGHFVADAEFHNFGRMAATTKSIKVTTYAVTPPFDNAKWLARHQAAKAQDRAHVLSSGTSFKWTSAPLFLDASLVRELNDGTSLFVLFATICYDDPAGGDHETQTCWIYDPRVAQLQQNGALNFSR